MIKHSVRSNIGTFIDVDINKGRAIKIMCTECMGYKENPDECTDFHCPLFPFKKKTRIAFVRKVKDEVEEVETDDPEDEEEITDNDE